MPVLGWEKTYTCPYNPAHQITVERLQFHLVKCRRNHPASNVAICPFNSGHHVPRPEMSLHTSTCSDRRVVESIKYNPKPAEERYGLHESLSERRAREAELPPSTEDWEAEATVINSYNPIKMAMRMPVLRKLEGGTPSQRKEFRAAERVRLEMLEHRGSLVGREGRTSLLSTTPGSVQGQGILRRPTVGSREGSSVGQLRRPGSSFLSSTSVPARQDTNTSFRTNTSVRTSVRSTASAADSVLDQAIATAGALARPPGALPRPAALRRPLATNLVTTRSGITANIAA